METKKLGCLSLSGGMDSTSLLIKLLADGYEVKALSFNYGQKHIVELERVQKNISYLKSKGFDVEHTIIDLSILGKLYNSALTNKDIEVPKGSYTEENQRITVVPNRNAIFSSIMYGYAISLSTERNVDAEIFLGVHAGDLSNYKDCSPEFTAAIENAFKLGNWGSERVNYTAPYLHGNKTSILRDCLKNCETLGLDFDTVLANTNTCYNPNEKGESDGVCGACTERVEAFISVERKDPVQYQQDWEVVKENVIAVLAASK